LAEIWEKIKGRSIAQNCGSNKAQGCDIVSRAMGQGWLTK